MRKSINASNLNEILFTSGGTESNNLALHGILKLNLKTYQHIITSPFEHPSVLNLLKSLQNSYENIQISFVNVNSNGIIDLEHFRQLIQPQTKLVSIMHSNNEIGLFHFFKTKHFHKQNSFLLKDQFNQLKKSFEFVVN